MPGGGDGSRNRDRIINRGDKRQDRRKPVRIATRMGKRRSLSGHESRQKNTQPQNLKKSPLHEVIEITTFIYDSLSERKDTPVFSGAPDWYPSASYVRRHG
jgi:hypothetical protein